MSVLPQPQRVRWGDPASWLPAFQPQRRRALCPDLGKILQSDDDLLLLVDHLWRFQQPKTRKQHYQELRLVCDLLSLRGSHSLVEKALADPDRNFGQVFLLDARPGHLDWLVCFFRDKSELRPSYWVGILRTLKQFLKNWEHGGELAGFVIPRMRQETVHRALSSEEIERLEGACDTSTIRGRSLLFMVKFAIYTGLRARELANVRVEHLWLSGHPQYRAKDGAMLYVQASKTTGKLAKPRYIGIKMIEPLITAYLAEAKPTLYLFEPFLCGQGGEWGFAHGGRLEADSLWFRIRKLVKKAGLPSISDGQTWRYPSTHCLRFTAAVQMAEAGHDILSVQKHLGHEQLTTTQHYLETPSLHQAIRVNHLYEERKAHCPVSLTAGWARRLPSQERKKLMLELATAEAEQL